MRYKIIFLSFIIVLFAFILFYFNILVPSYYSYKLGCEPQNFTSDFIVLGEYNEDTNKIIVYSEVPSVSKHELIHYNQDCRKRLPSCEEKIKYILTEVEAYTFSHLPDFVFNLFYKKKMC